MTNELDIFNKTQLKTNVPDIRPGDVVRVHLKVKEKDKDWLDELLEKIRSKIGLGRAETKEKPKVDY